MFLVHSSPNIKEPSSEFPLTQATLLRENNKKKKQIYSRIIVGCFIVLVLAVFLFFSTLGDTCNNWSIINNSKQWLRFVFIMIDVVAISVLIVLANIELKTTFYRKSKFTFWYFLIINIVFYYAFSLTYLLPLYGFLPQYANTAEQYNLTSKFALGIIRYLIIGYAVLVVAGVLILSKFGRDVWKKHWIFPLLYANIVVMIGIFSMVYFLAVSGWTTFLFLAIIAMSSDTMGYFFGSRFGKNKIARKISPNKTWEGFIYGTIATLIFGLLILMLYSSSSEHNIITNIFLNKPINTFKSNTGAETYIIRGYIYYWWITAGAIILLLSITDYIGDITMSYIKRKFNIKDFSHILKSHGGILDRIDGLTCVFFVFIIVWTIICILSGPTADVFNPTYNWNTSGIYNVK